MFRRLFVFILLVGFAPPLSAHINDEAKQAYATMKITDEAVEVVTTIPARYAFPTLLDGVSPIEMDRLDPKEMAARIGPVLAEHNPVKIDGVSVRPTIVGTATDMMQSRLPARSFTEAQVMRFGELRYVAVYELKNAPRRVSLTWDVFVPEYDEFGDPVGDGETSPVPVSIRVGEKQVLAVLTADEPEYVWHSDEKAAIPADLYASRPVRPAPLSVPVLSLCVLLAGLLLAFGLYRKSHGLGVGVALGAIFLVLLSWPVGRVSFERTASFPPMEEAEALELFRALHANIYRAFDYTDEGAIYDALAQSVDGPMLEEIYNDVYQSLILREEGGAVCKVRKVQIDSAELINDIRVEGYELPPREPGAFVVDVSWTVDGLVQHYGHTHSRTNAFEAVYVVAPRRDGWRIVDAHILDQQRIE